MSKSKPKSPPDTFPVDQELGRRLSDEYWSIPAQKARELLAASPEAPFIYPLIPDSQPLKDGVMITYPQKWWGVYSAGDKRWAFSQGIIAHYPHEAIADAHAKTLGPSWKAEPFGT